MFLIIIVSFYYYVQQIRRSSGIHINKYQIKLIYKEITDIIYNQNHKQKLNETYESDEHINTSDKEVYEVKKLLKDYIFKSSKDNCYFNTTTFE